MENQNMTGAHLRATVGRRRPALLRVCALLVCLFAVLPAAADTLLWRVEAEGAAPSYLFGTIHSDDPRVAHLPPVVAGALGQSRVLYLELDFAAPELALVPLAQVLPSGQSLADLISPAVHARLLEAMASRGYSAEVVNRLRPWAAILELAMPPMESGHFLDLLLYEYAIQHGIPARGLETIGEQLAIFDNLSLEEQEQVLVMTLDEYAEGAAGFENLVAAYADKDLATLERLSAEAFAGLSPDFATRFEAALITERNRRMARRAAPALDAGAAFIAVGALHLPGKEGLVALLRGRGYTLTPVY